MNLTTEPWIPIVWSNGEPGMVSLLDAFDRGTEIQDLALRPHERIAVMRLLICIAQAALDGPADFEDWKTCRASIASAARRYLNRWPGAFELLGDGPRFMQVKGTGKPGIMGLDKLDFVDADMTTLFDQDVTPGRKRSLAWTALHLLTYQSFAAGGKVGGSIEVGDRIEPQSGSNGPCRDSSAFHAFIKRENLISTLHANIITKESISQMPAVAWGVPVWETNAASLTGLQKTASLTRSYLGRLAPLSRAVWLSDDESTASNSNGLVYENFEQGVREPGVSIIIRSEDGQQKHALLSAADGESIKKPWRELHALTVKRISENGAGGPLTLKNLNDDESFDLWVGALVAHKAKVDDTVESSFAVPAGMLKPQAQRDYETGVRYAEAWEIRLRRAITIYRLAVETNESPERLPARCERMRRPERQRFGDISGKACSDYWTVIEHQLGLLNRFAIEPIPARDGKIQPGETAWGKHVIRSARASYERACPHQTARQIRAYALGLKTFFAVSRGPIEAEKEVEA